MSRKESQLDFSICFFIFFSANVVVKEYFVCINGKEIIHIGHNCKGNFSTVCLSVLQADTMFKTDFSFCMFSLF